jgi:LPS export ABC transporter protein LptC
MSPTTPPDTSAPEQRKTYSFAPRPSNQEMSASSIVSGLRQRRSIRNLILLAVLIIGGGVISALITSEEEDIKVQVTEESPEAEQPSGSLEVKGLNFRGITKDGNDFLVSAETARELENEPNLVQLTSLRAEVQTPSGKPMTLRSERGTFHRSEARVILEGGVVIDRPDIGYILRTERAVAYLDNGLITSDRRVQGSTPSYTIDADGIVISDGGKNITFKGELTLRPLTDP